MRAARAVLLSAQVERGLEAVTGGVVTAGQIGQGVESDGCQPGQPEEGLAEEADCQEKATRDAQQQLPVVPDPTLGAFILLDGVAQALHPFDDGFAIQECGVVLQAHLLSGVVD